MPEALVCPTCSAPLQYPAGGGASMQCPYCHTTVLLSADKQTVGGGTNIPKEFRPMIAQALKMAQQAGHAGPLNKIEAIRFYRSASGASLSDAKRVIESMGPLMTHAPGAAGNLSAQMIKPVKQGMMVGCVIAIAIFIGTGAAVLSVVASIRRQVQSHTAWVPPTISPSARAMINQVTAQSNFASMSLEFGSDGVAPGRFKDARSIAIDGQDHIYVGEYSNGRVQAFDSTGTYLSEFSVGKDKSLLDLFADRNGTIYAVVPGHIFRYTGSTGVELEEMDNNDDDMQRFYMDACISPTGDIYAIAGNSQIVKLNAANGKIVSSFSAAEKVGEDLDFSRIAAVATGEIYAIDRQKGVFKFGNDGRYINRFGGGEGTGPSHLGSPQNIAVDGQGRIYVSDYNPSIKVFTADGGFIDGFGGNDVCFGLAINDKDEIFGCFRNKHSVRKFVLSKH